MALAAGAEAATDLDVDVGDRAEAGGDRGEVEGGAVAELAPAAFDRDDDREGLGAGVVVWAWRTTVGSPPERGPLKIVSGEFAATGLAAREISASILPLPTIAPRQRRRASSGLASAILSGRRVGARA